MAFDAAVASVTLTGSILSFLATLGVLISFVFYHDQQRSFRHALVLNLTLAEFMNSLDNSISGIIYIKNKELQPGAACVLNGMIGQLSVQASDFSILAIAVVTFLTITRKTYMPNTSTSRKVIICLSVWIVPIVTSITATAMGTMQPVSGNWCWISRDRPDLRYALTHGWRFGIIFTTILIYLYVWWYLGRHFRSMVSTSDPLYESGDSSGNVVTSSIRKKQGFEVIQAPELEMDQFERPKQTSSTPSKNAPSPQRPAEMPFEFQARGAEPARRSSSDNDEDKEAEEQQTRPSESSRRSHFIEDTIDEEPRRKMSARISRFDNDDLDMSQASEARFSYLEQEDKLHQSAAGGPLHHHQDMQPPVAARYSRYGMGSITFGSNNKRGNRSRSSTLSWHLPPSRELHSRDFPLNPSLNHVVQSKQVPQNVTATMMSDFPIRKQTRKVEREIKRMMLLNAYPVMYVVLWIPGLVNRLMEASGNNSQSRVLAALQSSSQYIGLANAITYGFNQHVRHRIKGDLFGWMRRR
ncbi:glucose receptor git3 protein [Colletotrichum incanum]|nr:glucose receptor git3 protein [Colletotrichum incanum]